jgi:hypothetical protein
MRNDQKVLALARRLYLGWNVSIESAVQTAKLELGGNANAAAICETLRKERDEGKGAK